MAKQAKTALASILDKVNQIGTVSGGDVQSSIDNLDHAPSEKKYISDQKRNFYSPETVIEIDPSLLKNWEYHDRTPEELGDLDNLAAELKSVGQIHPCIARPCVDDSVYQYEVIVGERRWRAAKIAGIKLKIIVKPLNDHNAALCQAIENSNRKDLSEYAKGMSYALLVEKGVVTQKELQTTLKLSQSSIRNLLSYARIKPEITKAIENFTKVTSTTAYEITRLQEKGLQYITTLIDLSDKLRSGKVGYTKLQELVEERMNTTDSPASRATPVTTKNGRHIFTWRKDTNGQKSITFPKNIRNLINYNRLENMLMEEIQSQLGEIEK
jgi:ParB family chromosome partitioning protein